MPVGDIETFPDGDGWHNRREGDEQLFSSHETKAQAEEAARTYAENHHLTHTIRNLDGQLSERHSYGTEE